MERTTVSITIFNSQQDGNKKQGLQLTGRFESVDQKNTPEAVRLWASRISPDSVTKTIKDYAGWDSMIYKIEIDWIKIFDEKKFGDETWIECTVQR